MAISRRSKQCWTCKHLLDYCPESPFPISCMKNGEDSTFPQQDIKKRDFPDGLIRESAKCPNRESGASAFALALCEQLGVKWDLEPEYPHKYRKDQQHGT